jgi:uncharacterized LabA/DUF88 family protein
VVFGFVLYPDPKTPEMSSRGFGTCVRDTIARMKSSQKPNIAFVDAQNVYFGTTKCNGCAARLGVDIKDISLSDCTCGTAWKVDLRKFRIYLKEKYHVAEAYYVLGYLNEKNQELYSDIQKSGFIIIFKEHTELLRSKKKGNVDTDIVFEAMRNLIDNQDFARILLVSGDGDYKKLVNYLISKDRFEKILFPNKRFASSLYKEFGSERFDYLENIKTYIAA